MSERSNGPSSITKKVRRNFRRRCASIALRLTSCLIPYGLVLTTANFVPEPISPDRQLAASLYRPAHGVIYTVLDDAFGISKESGCVFFNKVIRLIVAYFYDEYMKLPETDEQWEVEVCGFIENYSFPAVGAWDGFLKFAVEG